MRSSAEPAATFGSILSFFVIRAAGHCDKFQQTIGAAVDLFVIRAAGRLADFRRIYINFKGLVVVVAIVVVAVVIVIVIIFILVGVFHWDIHGEGLLHFQWVVLLSELLLGLAN